MTRETKLGLVVAGSFLTLVGGVVVARLKHVELPGDPPEAVAKAEGEPSAAKPAEPGASATGVGESQPTQVAQAPSSPRDNAAAEPAKQKQDVSSEALAHAGDKKLPPAPDTAPATFPPVDPPAAAVKPATAPPAPPVQ